MLYFKVVHVAGSQQHLKYKYRPVPWGPNCKHLLNFFKVLNLVLPSEMDTPFPRPNSGPIVRIKTLNSVVDHTFSAIFGSRPVPEMVRLFDFGLS